MLTAATADPHLLYEKTVQDNEVMIDFIETIFHSRNKRRPLSLREDFCGTAGLCADWVRSDPKRRAVGLDIDEAGLLGRPALSFFGVAGRPVRLAEAERLLDGNAPDPALFAEAAEVVSGALEPPADDHASSEYRAHVAGVLTRRGLAEATARATERLGL